MSTAIFRPIVVDALAFAVFIILVFMLAFTCFYLCHYSSPFIGTLPHLQTLSLILLPTGASPILAQMNPVNDAAHFGNRGAATLPQPEKGRGTGCETVKTF